MSIRQENRKKNIKNIFITLIAAAVLVAVGLAVVQAQSGSFSSFEQRPESYYYSSDANSVYSTVGDGLAVASSTGLKVFGKDGVQTLNETYVMDSPAVSSGGNNAVVYDIGGNTAKIFCVDSIVQNIKSDGVIISAKMNDKGWTAVCSEETGYQGAVYVYNKSGSLTFKWLSASSYILSAAVSPDCESLGVLCVNSSGTHILYLDLLDESHVTQADIPNDILFDLGFDPSGNIYALSASCLYYIDSHGNSSELYRFEGMYLSDYCIDSRAVLALDEYKSGGNCRIVSISSTGDAKTVSEHENGIVSMAVKGDYTAVLTDSALSIYKTDSASLTASYDVSACVKALTYKDGTTVAASRHSAGVYSPKGN